jgi:cob(I)alamin adenosyltransferase
MDTETRLKQIECDLKKLDLKLRLVEDEVITADEINDLKEAIDACNDGIS